MVNEQFFGFYGFILSMKINKVALNNPKELHLNPKNKMQNFSLQQKEIDLNNLPNYRPISFGAKSNADKLKYIGEENFPNPNILKKMQEIGESKDFSLYNIYGYAGEAIAFSAFIMVIYEKWLWKYNPFEKTPVLKKKYRGTLVSTYDGIKRDATLDIKQSLLAVSVIFTTGESKSKSISASIDKIQEEWQLTYCFLNVPQAKVRERSEIHYGTAMLCIENPEEIQGQYYTDRKTIGDMKFIPLYY